MAVAAGLGFLLGSANGVFMHAGQSSADPSPLMPPPPPPPSPLVVVPDTAYTRYPVSPTFPPNYESLAEGELALDLADPSNVRTEAEYDPATGCYNNPY